MKQKTIIAGMLIGLLLAPATMQANGRHRGGHCCCCCCCRHDDQRPPKGKERPSQITDKLIKKLSLTDEQVTKLKEEENAFMEKMKDMRPDPNNRDKVSQEEMKAKMSEMKEKMDAMMNEHDAAVKKILTNKQYKKYQKYMEENRPQGPGNGGPGGPGGPEGPGGMGESDGEW